DPCARARGRRRGSSCECEPRGCERGDPLGVVRGDEERASRMQLAELVVEELRALRVERGVRLVEHEQLRVVQQDAAEREPLRQPASIRRDVVVPDVPEAVALEQHADRLAALGHAVETAVQVEVLERAELPVDERLVAEVPDARALGLDLEVALARDGEAGADAEERRLAGAVRAGDEAEPSAWQVEVDVSEDALDAEGLAEPARADHVTASAITNTANATLMTPFIVKKAASRRRRSPGRTSECS